MSEYLEWKQEGAPAVRVHRRVPGGMEREREPEFRGILLGTVSDADREIVVEDYETIPRGSMFDPKTGTIAGQTRHSLGAIGYFRVTTNADARLGDEDGAAFDRDFPAPLSILLLFRRVDGTVQWAEAYIQPGVEQPPGQAVFREDEPPTHMAAEPMTSRTRRPYLWPAIAAIACALIVGAAYLAADHDVRRENARAAEPAKPERPPLADWKPVQTPVPAPAPPASAAPASDADRLSAPPANKAEVRQQIRSLIDEWRTALLKEDVNTYASLYAPTVGPYFRDSRVSRAQIADEVRRMLGRYGALTSYKISDVTIAPVDENHAIANFRKEWNTVHNAFAGAEKAQLRFERQNGKWLITSEQELRVYWARKR